MKKLFLFTFLVILTGCFPNRESAEANKFLNMLSQKMDAPQKEIVIKNLVDFQFDKVCFSNKSDSLKHFVSPTITKDEEWSKKIQKSQFSLVFFNEKEITSLIRFQNYHRIKIDEKEYRFLNNLEGNICKSSESAYLQSQLVETECCGPEYEIIFK